MTTKPTRLQLSIAAGVLLDNQGEIEEYEACQHVASWLHDTIMLMDIKRLAVENNIPYGKLKSKLVKKMKEQI